MKINIIIEGATPDEVSTLFRAWALKGMLPPYSEPATAPTQCDGPGREPTYGDKPAPTPTNTIGNTLVMSDGSRRDNPADAAAQKARKSRAKKEAAPAPEVAPTATASATASATAPAAALPSQVTKEGDDSVNPFADEQAELAAPVKTVTRDELRAEFRLLAYAGTKEAGMRECERILKAYGMAKLAELRDDQLAGVYAETEAAVAKLETK